MEGHKIVVVDPSEVDDYLARDMTHVRKSWCVWYSAADGARNRAVKVLGCACHDLGPTLK